MRMQRKLAPVCAYAVAAALTLSGSLAAQVEQRLDMRTEIPNTGDGVNDKFDWYQKYFENTQDILLRTTEQKNNYIVKTFPIRNCQAIDIQSYLLRSTKFENAVVEVMGKGGVNDPETGAGVQFLIVTAPDFMMPGIAEMVELCDIPGFVFHDGTGNTNSAGVAGATTYVGKHRTASQLVSILSGTEIGNVGAFLFPPFADNSLNSIYIVENPGDIADDLLALEAFDRPPLQVDIKATIYELEDGDGSTLGLDWSAWKRYISGSLDFAWFSDMGNTEVRNHAALISLDARVLTEFLNYLVDEGKANVLTETNITATNDFDPTSATGQVGRVARIFSGSIIPFITPPSQTADVPVSPERKDIQDGVELLITPYVAAESVSLDIGVTVSSLMGYVPDTHYPIVSTQQTTSFNNAKFGETIVLGGLNRTATLTHETGIPFIKDIPVVGYLFKKETKSTRKTRLIVTLTPTLKEYGVSDAVDTTL